MYPPCIAILGPDGNPVSSRDYQDLIPQLHVKAPVHLLPDKNWHPEIGLRLTHDPSPMVHVASFPRHHLDLSEHLRIHGIRKLRKRLRFFKNPSRFKGVVFVRILHTGKGMIQERLRLNRKGAFLRIDERATESFDSDLLRIKKEKTFERLGGGPRVRHAGRDEILFDGDDFFADRTQVRLMMDGIRHRPVL